ncbi:MAG: YciI family protein [Candidatus Hydrogenedentes bacterium]|nr:YciI family protein [Candidatus Hydrogenedentota bacterium]
MSSDNNRTSQYLLLFRGSHWEAGLSPDQLQEIMGRWSAWFEGLEKSGKLKGAQPLLPEGKIVSGKNGKSIADGPFAESKEVISGYFLVEVDSLEDALEFAKTSPLLEYGMTVEVRPVAVQCPTMQRVSEQMAHASA